MFYNLKYNDQIRELLRSGQFDDSYVDINEERLIVNNKICLSEIPDENERVLISGYVEILEDFYEQQYEIHDNEFVVNYQNGVVLFNKSQENKRVKAKYKGKGVIQYPAERILVHAPNPWAVENLQELIDLIFAKEKELKEEVRKSIEFIRNKTDEYERFIKKFTSMYEKYIDDRTREYKKYIEDLSAKFKRYIDAFIERAEMKIRLMDVHIELCKKQTDECKLATDEAKDITEKAKKIIEETIKIKDLAYEVTQKCIKMTELARKATLECRKTTDECKEELKNLKIDRLNTRFIWKESVDSIADIYVQYPKPIQGWVVMTKDDGNLYRWSGVEWVCIGNLRGAIPLASEKISGLMSKDDFIKLKGIEEKSQKNYIGEDAKNALPKYCHTKTIVFVLSKNTKIKAGVQNVIIPFPNDGIITDIRGVCQTPAIDNYISIHLEKISKENFESRGQIADSDIEEKNRDKCWIRVCEDNKQIIFNSGQYVSNKPKILYPKVNAGDVFRLYVGHIGGSIAVNNITISVDILI